MCKYHENFSFAFDGLKKACPQFPTYSRDLVETFLYSPAGRKCWMNESHICMDGKKFRSVYVTEESCDASWFKWKTDDEGRLTKAVEEGSTDDLVDYICSLIPQFVEYCFVKRKLATAFNIERETVAVSRIHSKACSQISW